MLTDTGKLKTKQNNNNNKKKTKGVWLELGRVAQENSNHMRITHSFACQQQTLSDHLQE